jgi:nicotinate-nucleotide adenylyltransferase
VNTLVHLQEKYPNYEFSLIMGEDNLRSLHKWKNYEAILAHHEIYVYPRLEAKGRTSEAISSEAENPTFKNHSKIHMIDAPVVEISSTFIRDNIKKGKNVQPLLPSKVWEYIDHNNFYKK